MIAGLRGRRLVGVALTGVLLPLLLAGCTVKDAFAFGWPKGGITKQSQQMYDLWIGSVIAALIVGLIVWVLIFWCIVRYRKTSDELPVQTRYNLPIEIVYTVIPVLIVAVLFYYTAIVQTDVNKTSTNPDVKVEVVAAKWNWQFRYLDDNAKRGNEPVSTIGSADEIPVLVVPTGKRVQFLETSMDVIHSFWVPELLFKRDVIPGHPNKFEVTIESAGAYVGRCAELCGTYHSQMNFELRAVSFENYQKFIEQKKTGKTTAEALVAIGESGLATTTHPFDPSRTARKPS